MKHLSLKQLMHREVRNLDGKPLGHVSDLVIHPDAGRVEFVRLAFLTEGDWDTAIVEVPWSQFETEGDDLKLNVSRGTLARVARLRQAKPLIQTNGGMNVKS
jgi:sporulation protein YlmC with PRC-barrel domain